MLGKELSEALGGICPEMVEEALSCGYKKGRKKMWLRVAALAATIAIVLTLSLWPSKDGLVTAPGVLKVYAQDNIDGAGYVTNMFDDALKYQPAIESVFLNSSQGIPITFQIPDDYWGEAEITYEVHTNVGEFWMRNEEGHIQCVGNSYVTQNNKKFFWRIYSTNAEEIIKENNGIYVDVVIYADGVPVGYAVIEIGGESHYFFAVRTETICLPLVDGKYQPVTEAYILQSIEKLKQQCSSEYTYEEKNAEYMAYIESIFGNADTN